jgi:starch phosphorylase
LQPAPVRPPSELSGDDRHVTDLSRLAELEDFGFRSRCSWRDWKRQAANKADFADWLLRREGIRVRLDAIYDVQIKRLHEYKRQLMNAFYILDLYFRVKAGEVSADPARVFIFGAKAAPGYHLAKAIIKLINEIARLINGDPATKESLQVVFIANYNASAAEKIIPAAISPNRFSWPARSASGTGNMKFMMNGSLDAGHVRRRQRGNCRRGRPGTYLHLWGPRGGAAGAAPGITIPGGSLTACRDSGA